MAALSIEQIEARQAEIRQRLAEIDAEFAGERLPDDRRAEWNDLNGELEANDELLDEVRARRERLEAVANRPQNQEPERTPRTSRNGDSRVPDNPFDLAEYRARTSSEAEYRQALRDGAMKVVEISEGSFSHPDRTVEDQQGDIARLLDKADMDGSFARRVIETSKPHYARAFTKWVLGGLLTGDEQRSLGIGSQGGNYPVPVTLDPTVILTSNGQVNPLRQIGRVVQITGNTWNGVTSAGVTAAYGAEFTEASDNSPTLAQAVVNVEKAQAFVPFSIEVSEDWASLQSEMAVLFQDAKDSLEATKFLSGSGHSSTEPQGLHNGATAVVSTAATATFAVADLYSAVNALAERWQPNASIVANRAVLNKVRQFDTSGGASLWVQLGAGIPSRLLDYPTFNYSTMSTAFGTSNATILTIGDFRQFLIVDRVGMDIELIPHMFATANNRPSGTRALYMHYRNSSAVVTQLAFKSVKVL